MANQQNILKLLSALSGASSESYGQGNFQKVGGQPLLPKPQMSMPHALSPYAPGNQGGGVHAQLGGIQAQDSSGPQVTPNKTGGVIAPNMRNSPNHPAAQLAQYLATQEGRHPSARLKSFGTDPGMFIRGGQGQASLPGVSAGVRG
jgi:hypothetical protein